MYLGGVTCRCDGGEARDVMGMRWIRCYAVTLRGGCDGDGSGMLAVCVCSEV